MDEKTYELIKNSILGEKNPATGLRCPNIYKLSDKSGPFWGFHGRHECYSYLSLNERVEWVYDYDKPREQLFDNAYIDGTSIYKLYNPDWEIVSWREGSPPDERKVPSVEAIMAIHNAICEKPQYRYKGIMLDYSEKEIERALAQSDIILPQIGNDWRLTKNLHITTIYKENGRTDYADIGSKANFLITGYGYDPQIGLALKVELTEATPRVRQEYEDALSLKTPHITLATAPGRKPKDSALLFLNDNTQVTFNKPIKSSGIYGGMTKEGIVDTLCPIEEEYRENFVYSKNQRDALKLFKGDNSEQFNRRHKLVMSL